MVTLSQSQTMPINPSSASPPLTHPEIWRALHLKCRQPELFVASITSSAVIQETPTFMKRSVTLREGMGPPGGKAVEELQIRAPWKVHTSYQPPFPQRGGGDDV